MIKTVFWSIVMFLNENQIKFSLPSSEANCITLLGNMKHISPILNLFLQPALFSVLPQLSPLHYKNNYQSSLGMCHQDSPLKTARLFSVRYLVSAELPLGLGMTFFTTPSSHRNCPCWRKGISHTACMPVPWLVTLANRSFRLPSSLLQYFPFSCLFIRGWLVAPTVQQRIPQGVPLEPVLLLPSLCQCSSSQPQGIARHLPHCRRCFPQDPSPSAKEQTSKDAAKAQVHAGPKQTAALNLIYHIYTLDWI